MYIASSMHEQHSHLRFIERVVPVHGCALVSSTAVVKRRAGQHKLYPLYMQLYNCNIYIFIISLAYIGNT